MHARRSILGPPGAKEASLPGPDEQLELYGASDTALVRTDRLAPVSFAAPALASRTRTHPAPHFQPPPAIDYSAELQLAELLMSDTDDSLGQLTHLTLSAMVPNRAQHSKAKFANAPSRVHPRPSNSNNSSPATVSTRLSVDHVSTDHSLSQPEHDVRPVNPNPKHEERSSPPARSPIIEQSVSPSNMSSTTTATTTTTTKQRSARPNRRSPAPRRQECTTCGKKFQRPCQLVTHIRSHTGEQPHACPVCSRRFSVLSNCQRHVKLCQKRSAKVLNPSEDDLCADSSGTVTSFIQFPGDTCPPQPAPAAETAPRRGHEVPIRPKLVSRESGSTGSIGSIGSAAPAPGARRPNRAGSSSSVDSPAPKLEAPSMPPSLERSGSGSTVPVVVPSSSAYPTSSYGYPPPNAYSQGTYDSSGSAFNNAYTGYSAPNSGYVQVGAASASGFKQNNAIPNFEAASAAAYDSLNPGFSAVPAYGSASPGYDRPESGFNQPYAAAAAGPSSHSPAHTHPHPQSQATPLTSSPGSISHDTGSYFTSVPGMYVAPTARRPSVTSAASSRRATITYTQMQRDALGFHDAGSNDVSSVGTTGDAAAVAGSSISTGSGGGTGTASGSYYSSSSGLVAASYETQPLKQEEVVPDMGQPSWAKESSYQTGYSEPQWASAAGAETPSYHAYHTGSGSSTDLAGPHESHVASTSAGYAAYSQQQQPQQQPTQQQQLYLHQTQGAYPSPSEQQQQQQAQQHDGYGNPVYASRSAPYAMSSGIVSVPRHAQDSTSYGWPSSETTWNTQPGYRS